MNNSVLQHSFNKALALLNSELSAREVANGKDRSFSTSQLSQALQNSEQKYNLATQVISEGICSWDLALDLVEYSPRWKSMLGYDEPEIEHSLVEWLARVHLADLEKLKSHLAECWSGEIEGFEIEYSLLHRD